MKLLFDQNISFRLTKKLQNYFPGSLHVSDCGLLDSEDQEIWEYARDHGFAIVTFDADFYDISIINGQPPKIIWITTHIARKDFTILQWVPVLKHPDRENIYLARHWTTPLLPGSTRALSRFH